ncbi:MAG: ankyrin repeat domain-containing protein [Candidatus Cardinium sp.]
MMGKKDICLSFKEKFFEAVIKGVPCQESDTYSTHFPDLLHAITSGSLPLIKALFKSYSHIYKKCINLRFEDGSASEFCTLRPLDLPLRKGLIETTKVLLDNGANMNLLDNWGNTFLHKAAALDDEKTARKIVEILLKTGANIKANSNNETPIDVAESLGRQEIVDLLNKELAKLK